MIGAAPWNQTSGKTKQSKEGKDPGFQGVSSKTKESKEGKAPGFQGVSSLLRSRAFDSAGAYNSELKIWVTLVLFLNPI